MVDLGHFALVLAWGLSVYGILAGFYGALKNHRAFQRSAENSVFLSAGLILLSLVVLGVSFLRHDYRYAYVWQNSNNDMDGIYLISAIWGGMDGSMLLWATLLSLYSASALYRTRAASQKMRPYLAPMFQISIFFFSSVVTWLTNPFRLVPAAAVPLDGNGLNPLLQNPSMLIHPPSLYMGLTGFVVPFSFGLAALMSGELSNLWIQLVRRSTLVAWGFLTLGIILGGNWAYIELGWGGFWAWDPVENASFMPWLVGTAFIHSVMVQETRGMLKVWNLSLSTLAYLLAVFGTFLTRSGVVQSVHAFAETDVGWVFLVYIAVLGLLSMALIVSRRKLLAPENQIVSFFSREAAFLFNNLALLAICFATFWGVMFPVLSEAVTGKKEVVGPPFFNLVNVPFFCALLFLMGVGPLIAWKKTSRDALKRMFLRPLLSSSVVTLGFLLFDHSRPWPAVTFGLVLFVINTVFSEWRRAAKAAETPGVSAIKTLVTTKRRKFAGMLVHLGIGVMAIAITASSAYKLERDMTLKTGEKSAIGHYELALAALEQINERNYQGYRADILVYEKGTDQVLTHLYPEKRWYPKNQESTSEVDMRMTPRDDLYLAFAGLDENSSEAAPGVVLKVFVNPLQVWLWVGALIVLSGTILILLPTKER